MLPRIVFQIEVYANFEKDSPLSEFGSPKE